MEENRLILGDWAASAPISREAAEAMRPFLLHGEEEMAGNPSSLHTAGLMAKDAVEEARRSAASLIGAKAEELFFTSGGTESINWAIKGAAFHALAHGSKRRRILVSAIEHPAVLRASEALIPFGFSVERVPVSADGTVSLDAIRRMTDEHCLLVAVMHANNETGVIQPAAECSKIAHSHGALFFTDGVQTVGHIPVNVDEIGCDLLAVSGHKMGAPKGIGALYVRENTPIFPLIHGGGQENGMRGGTENVPGIVGFGAACRTVEKHLQPGEMRRLEAIRDEMEARLLSLGGCTVNGGKSRRLPGISSLSFEDISGEGVMHLCDFYSVCISTGSACSAGKGDGISHVLRAMGVPDSLANGSVRVSIGASTSREDAMKIVSVLADCVEKMRAERKTNVERI